MTLADALRLYNKGCDAMRSGRTELPYSKQSQEARWWTKGWLETYRAAKSEL